MKTFKSIIIFLLFSASVVGQATTTTASTKTELNVTDAYVRPLTPGQKNTAAYMHINNPTEKTYVLTGAASSIANKTELHTVLMEEGMMRMRESGPVTLLPGQSLLLQPGDLHIMLMHVNTALTQGMQVPICLEFKDAQPLCLQIPVVEKDSRKTATHGH